MRRHLYILSTNTRFFYTAVHVLKKNHVPFRALDFGPNEYRPKSLALIITTKEEEASIKQTELVKVYALDPEIEPDVFLLRVLSKLSDLSSNNSLTVGIDPGTTKTGVAYLVNKKTIHTFTTYDFSLIPDYVSVFADAFPDYKHFVLKIGNGVPRLTKTFINILRVRPDLPYPLYIELVDESNTTVKRHRRWSLNNEKTRDEIAAIKIAHREGIRLSHLSQI